MRIFRWALGGILVSILGCVIAFVVWAWPVLYVPPVKDFRLVGVERVTRDSFRPCDASDIECLSRLPYEEYLRIRVTTDRNLMDHASAHELNVWKEVWSCNLKPDRYAMSEFIAPGPYVDEAPVPYPSPRGIAEFYAAIDRVPGADLSYDIYVVPRWSQTSNASEANKERAPPYDVMDGRDLCLRIGGGNMLGGHFVGNTVRVTSADMRAAWVRQDRRASPDRTIADRAAG